MNVTYIRATNQQPVEFEFKPIEFQGESYLACDSDVPGELALFESAPAETVDADVVLECAIRYIEVWHSEYFEKKGVNRRWWHWWIANDDRGRPVQIDDEADEMVICRTGSEFRDDSSQKWIATNTGWEPAETANIDTYEAIPLGIPGL